MMTKFIPEDQEKVIEDAAIRSKLTEARDSPTPQVTGSNLTSNVFFTETLAREHLKKHISLVLQVTKRSG